MAQKHNKQFYAKAIQEYGISAQGVHWNNKHTQYKRFEVIVKLLKKDIQNSTIADIGCGFGEFYHYLKQNNKLPKNYIGLDCEKQMIDVCNSRFDEIEFSIKNALDDELPTMDYYVCSGALNILTKDEVNQFIKNCFDASNKGFVFNFLKKDSFNKLKVDEMIEYCSTITQAIKTRDNYLDNDFTIFLAKK